MSKLEALAAALAAQPGAEATQRLRDELLPSLVHAARLLCAIQQRPNALLHRRPEIRSLLVELGKHRSAPTQRPST